MHRVLNVPQRLKALASPTKDDNRMSYGCINLPPKFYETALRRAVKGTGAIIYVLPETKVAARAVRRVPRRRRPGKAGATSRNRRIDAG